MKYRVTAYCGHVKRDSTHCNSRITVEVDSLDDVEREIEDKGWEVREDKVVCDEHYHQE